MIVSVSSQAYIFFCSIIGGIAIALVYDIFRILRKAVKTGNFVTYLEDILFWVIVAVVMFATVYYSNEGELRSYIFLGAILGVVLYAMLLSKAVMNSSLFIIKVFTTIVKTIWIVLSFPFKMVLRLLSIPLRAVGKLTGKSLRSIRRAGKNKLSKSSIWRKAFKNIRKKI
jgi:spore cortex biosynthesis protein YabQ